MSFRERMARVAKVFGDRDFRPYMLYPNFYLNQDESQNGKDPQNREKE